MMKKVCYRFATIAVVSLLCACLGNTSNTPATRALGGRHTVAPEIWNSDWQFFATEETLTLKDLPDANLWQPVTLPHTAKLEPRIVNNQWQGDAWYKKTFSFQPSWQGKRVFIDFEGAMNVAEVWLNGKKLSRHLGGYLPFSVLLNAALVQSQSNVLLVRLDNRDNEITGPKPLKRLDFNMYGGIYRNVWLRLENEVYITDAVNANKTASGGIFVRYPEVSARRARMSIQTHVMNTGGAANISVHQQLFKGNVLVAQAKQQLAVAANKDAEVQQDITVENPALWSPRTPALYRLKTQIFKRGVLKDEENTILGIRKFEFKNHALYLNGEKIFLRGVNRHQEYPYVGYALSDAAQYRDAEKIKAAGFDYVRLSHYPHSKAFMRAADELGLVLLDAILGWQYVNDTPAFSEHVVQTCRDLIRRDRNHASVLAWECSLNESPMPAALIQHLHEAVHEEYPSSTAYSAGWVPETYDIYLQARQHRIKHYTPPRKPYVVSEYGDWEYYAMNAGLNQDSWHDLLQEERSSRQLLRYGETRLQQQAANVMEAHNDNLNTPAFADGYWVMFDYNRGYADDLEASGIMSLERLPKFSYFFYQSQRDPSAYAGPLAGGYMAYIASYWQSQSKLSFYVYSNAQEVELFLNGRSQGLGRKDTDNYGNLAYPPFLFELAKFEAGELEVQAKVNGELVAQHRVVTPQASASIVLQLEESSIAPQAAVNDLLFVRAHILDAAGNPTRVNGKQVKFRVSGDATLVSPEKSASEAGVAVALIRVGRDLSSVRVDAQLGEFKAKTLILEPEGSAAEK